MLVLNELTVIFQKKKRYFFFYAHRLKHARFCFQKTSSNFSRQYDNSRLTVIILHQTFLINHAEKHCCLSEIETAKQILSKSGFASKPIEYDTFSK